MEIPRHTSIGSNCGRRHHDPEQDLRLLHRRIGSSAGQRDGSRNRPADERCRRSLAALRNRRWLALVLTYFKVPALAFALGMFIPLELNLPLLVGGAVNWYVTTRSKDEAVNAERGEKGTLLASGFIAGGALMGVVSAAMRFGGINLINEEWLSNPLSEVLSMAAYILLIIWLVKASMHIKKNNPFQIP